MSIQDEPRYAARAREKDALDGFAAEPTSSPAVPSADADTGAVDQLIRSLRSRGGSSAVADEKAGFSLAGYLRTHKLQVAAVAAAALIIIVGVISWPTIGDTADTLSSRLISSVLSLVPYDPPEPESPATVPTEPAPSRARSRPGQGAAPSQVPAGASSSPAAAEPVVAPPGAAPTRATDTPSAAPLAEETRGGAEFVYSRADPDVAPPKLISEGPGQPGREMNERTRLLELLVKPDGSVEHVLLRSTEARLLDAVLLSRAKMWQFEPARRAGRPVPYRLVMMWETPP